MLKMKKSVLRFLGVVAAFIMVLGMTGTAVFAANGMLNISINGQGKYYVNGDERTGGTGKYAYDGTGIELDAEAADGWHFVAWTKGIPMLMAVTL